MVITNFECIWTSVNDLAKALQSAYSVTGKEMIRKQYLEQVKQYPLYSEWFEKIVSLLDKQKKPIRVLEYGSGPGLLAERLVTHPKVSEYTAVEPENLFREMTRERTGHSCSIIDGNAEDYVAFPTLDLIVATATYHHFSDKPKALKRIYNNLRAGGKLVIADVFLPNYKYNTDYNPIDKTEFVEKVMEYAAAQIRAMPNPKAEDIVDQIKTTFLDILRVEELKVCLSIVQKQLKEAGFEDINCEPMRENNNTINYTALGYYFITARRGKQNVS